MTRALHRRAAHALGGVLVLATAAYALDAVHDVGTFFDGSYYNGVILGCVVLAAWRGIALREDRAAWLLIALGLGCWLAGDIWWVMNSDAAGVPIPSLGDAFYLGIYPPLATALVLLVRRRVGSASRMLALDGMIAAFAVSAVSAALALEPVIANASGTTAAMAVTIAYPICDIVLVGLLVEAAALGRWVLSRGWALLAAGLAAFAVMDGIHYAQVAQGTYAGSAILDVGWLVALLLVAFAAWEPAPRTAPARHPGWRELVPPGVFAAVAVGAAAYAYAADLNAFAMALACAALVAVIARMVATFRENLRILDAARREALTDALTGLGSRRGLVADLEARIDGGGRHLLVLCDLDGFKHYNDSFGQPAGDALLRRFGGRLVWTIAGHGRAYRMGGDEFCVLLDDALGADGATRLVAGALTEHGVGFDVNASCGAVALPDEAATVHDALRLADARMYEEKRGGRTSPGSESVATLLRLMSERGDDVAGGGEIASAVGERLGLGPAECEDVRVAAVLHDVGKLAIPDSIVRKAGPLDDEEWSFICRHPIIGERILSATPGLAGAGALVRASHERPDGCGYSDGLTARRSRWAPASWRSGTRTGR